MIRKKHIITSILLLLIVIICGIILFPNSKYNKTQKENNIEKGLTLDIARRFYKESEIKQFIDILSKYPNTFLQLHLSDDQNFSVENSFVHQTLNDATYIDGEWENNGNGQPFLSKKQLKNIVSYAQKKKVSIYPEIDFPSHNQILLDYLKQHKSSVYDSVYFGDSVPNSWNTLNYSKDTTIQVVQSILKEYTDIFSQQEKKVFHIGGDEFFDIAPKNDEAYVRYINTMSTFLKTKGYKTRIWNDGISKINKNNFDKDIEVTYWSPTGELDQSSRSEKAIAGRANIATAQELLNSGFKVLNYNGYYGYFMAGDRTFIPQAFKYTIRDIKNTWNIGNFNLDNPEKVTSTKNVEGISMTIWGEESEGYTSQEIINKVKPLLCEYLNAATYGRNFRKY